MAGYFQTGLEPLLEKTATPMRMARLQALANHPMTNPNEAAAARQRMAEMHAKALPPAAGAQAAQHAAQPGYQLNPQEMAQAGQMRTMAPAQRRQALGLGGDEMARASRNIASIPTPAAKPGLMRRMALPLGIGALAAGYGAMNRLEHDAKNDGLVYAPMMGM